MGSESRKKPSGTTRRSLISGAMAATAAGALTSGPVSLATADTESECMNPEYSLPGGTYRIDVHSHFLPQEYRTHLLKNGMAVPPWSAENHIKFMDTWGIQKSVVSVPHFHFDDQAETNRMARTLNEAGRALVDEHGDRFAVLASLPLPDVAASISELSYAFDTLRLTRGVILSSHYDGTYLGDPAYEALYVELARRGATVFVHPNYPEEEPVGPFPGVIMEFPFETTRAATNIIYHGLPTAFPDIQWQLSHMGGVLPFLLFRLALMQLAPYVQLVRPQTLGTPLTPAGAPEGPFVEASKLWYDTALAGSEEQLLSIEHLTGAPKVVFGTDWPFTDTLFSPTTHTVAPWFSDMLPKDGDPQPALSRVFTREERISIERDNPLGLYADVAVATR